MSALKVLGIDQITPKVVIKSLITLVLFSFFTSSLYDLWKLIPACFQEGVLELNGGSLFFYLFWVIIFCIWFGCIYRQYQKFYRRREVQGLSHHLPVPKGIILAMSKPGEGAETIERTVKESRSAEDLFHLPSIGQSFRSVYRHRESLQYVFLLLTHESRPYKACMAAFLKKYVPEAEMMDVSEMNGEDLVPSSPEQEIIERFKRQVGEIYSAERLENMQLLKSDIVTDITGGTKTMSIGMIFGALSSDCPVQYVEQTGQNVISLNVDPEMILDRIGEFFLSLHSQKEAARQSDRPVNASGRSEGEGKNSDG